MPEWIFVTVFTAVLGGLGWVLRDLYLAIKELTRVTYKQGEMISILQEQVNASIGEIKQSAIRAERQGKCNETQLADHEGRIVKIETEHHIFHNKH